MQAPRADVDIRPYGWRRPQWRCKP